MFSSGHVERAAEPFPSVFQFDTAQHLHSEERVHVPGRQACMGAEHDGQKATSSVSAPLIGVVERFVVVLVENLCKGSSLQMFGTRGDREVPCSPNLMKTSAGRQGETVKIGAWLEEASFSLLGVSVRPRRLPRKTLARPRCVESLSQAHGKNPARSPKWSRSPPHSGK